MPNIPNDDKAALDWAFEKLLRSAGFRENSLPWTLSELLDQGTDSSPTFGAVSVTSLASATAAVLPIKSSVATGASAVAVTIGASTNLTTSGAKLVSFVNNDTTEVLAVGRLGKLIVPTAGAAAVVGSAIMVGGTVTVATTAVLTASKLFITRSVSGGTPGHLTAGTIVDGTSFVISSSEGADTSTVNWWIIN